MVAHHCHRQIVRLIHRGTPRCRLDMKWR
jgi:hypothetical protein